MKNQDFRNLSPFYIRLSSFSDHLWFFLQSFPIFVTSVHLQICTTLHKYARCNRKKHVHRVLDETRLKAECKKSNVTVYWCIVHYANRPLGLFNKGGVEKVLESVRKGEGVLGNVIQREN